MRNIGSHPFKRTISASTLLDIRFEYLAAKPLNAHQTGSKVQSVK